MVLAWILMCVPVLAANTCAALRQDDSWVDRSVDAFASFCSTVVIEPSNKVTDWIKGLIGRDESEALLDDAPPLDQDQIELEIVDVSLWEFLDETTKARFLDVGLAPDMPRRSMAEAEALYETIPGTTRALGEERILEFLASHSVTYITPVEDVIRLADAPDNLVWELQTLNQARGERPMTAEEVAAAVIAMELKGQEAASRSSRTWYALNREHVFMDWFKQLGLVNRTRTQAEAFELYTTIPEPFRNEGFWAILYFLEVHALTYRLPVETDLRLASSFGNVVWEDRTLQANRGSRSITDTEVNAAERALWEKSLAAGTPSSRTWYELIQDGEVLGQLHAAGEQALIGFTGSHAELRDVYELVPGAIRALGPDSVRAFLNTHGLVQKVPSTRYLSLAVSPDNLVWEEPGLVEARGLRAMTRAEIAAAEKVLRTRFEAAASVMALGFVPEIEAPLPDLEDLSGNVERRLARSGLSMGQPDWSFEEILTIYASIPAPVRVQGAAPVEAFLDRYTISLPVPVAGEPSTRMLPEAITWEARETVRARGSRPMTADETLAAKGLMQAVARDAMPAATWLLLQDHPDFKFRFEQLAEALSAPEAIDVHTLYSTIPQPILLLGPEAVLGFLSEFGLSLKRPGVEFLALANAPANLVWEDQELTLARGNRQMTAQEITAAELQVSMLVAAAATMLNDSSARAAEVGIGDDTVPGFLVEGDSWESLDHTLKARLTSVGLASGTGSRAVADIVALYRLIPEGVRNQGNEAVRDFMDIHTVSRKAPLAEFWAVATGAGNSVWEASASALARGDTPASNEEVTAAREELIETYRNDLQILKADGVAAGLVAGVYVGSRYVLPRLQTPPPPVAASGTWNTLDPLLHQRFGGRGLPVGSPRRTVLQAQALYETVPPSIRVQGNAAVRDFLDTHALSYRQSVTDFPALAKVPGNAVWEPLETALARGDRPLTAIEAYRAKRAVNQEAGFAATRSGMTWYALIEDPRFLDNFKRRGLSSIGDSWSQAEAKALYAKIPLGIRNQGPEAVKTFLDEFDLSHIRSVSTNPGQARNLSNVVWEDPSLNRARGDRTMSLTDRVKARARLARVSLQAGSRSNRTWYAIAQDPERLAKIQQLGVSETTPHTRLNTKAMYEKIPREVRELGVDEVDKFVREYDLSHRLGRVVKAEDDVDIVWEKRSSKLRRGGGPMSDRQFNNARRTLDKDVAKATKSLKSVKAATRRTALKTGAGSALKGGLAGAVIELPIVGAESFLEWHNGRLSAEEAIAQTAISTGVSVAVGTGIAGGMTLVATLAPSAAALVAGAAPVIVPVVIVAGSAFVVVDGVFRLCTAAQPEPVAQP